MGIGYSSTGTNNCHYRRNALPGFSAMSLTYRVLYVRMLWLFLKGINYEIADYQTR